MAKTKKKIKKGDYGYIKSMKRKRILRTLLFFAVPLAFFIVGLILNKGDKKSIYTVIAVVGSLPACKSTVNLIVTWMAKPITPDEYQSIDKNKGRLLMVYDLYVTTYDVSRMLGAVAICGEEVVCYSTKPRKRTDSQNKGDIKAIEDYLVKMMRANGYKVHVKLFSEQKGFSERMASLNRNYETLEASANETFVPDERYPDLSRDEMVMHYLMSLSI